MNNMSDELREKLPPTDSRLRPDLRAWEHAQNEHAEQEKRRLESNQRSRRTLVQSQLE